MEATKDYKHLYEMALIQANMYRGDVICLMILLGIHEPYSHEAVIRAGNEIRRLRTIADLVPGSYAALDDLNANVEQLVASFPWFLRVLFRLINLFS